MEKNKIVNTHASDRAMQQMTDCNGEIRLLWEGIAKELQIDWTFDDLVDYFLGSRRVHDNPGPYVGTAVAFLRLVVNQIKDQKV